MAELLIVARSAWESSSVLGVVFNVLPRSTVVDDWALKDTKLPGADMLPPASVILFPKRTKPDPPLARVIVLLLVTIELVPSVPNTPEIVVGRSWVTDAAPIEIGFATVRSPEVPIHKAPPAVIPLSVSVGDVLPNNTVPVSVAEKLATEFVLRTSWFPLIVV